jgi:hypothetical protein
MIRLARLAPPPSTMTMMSIKNDPINMMRILIVCLSDGDRPGDVIRQQ